MKILIIGASSYLGARLYIDLKKDFEVFGTYSSNKLFSNLVKLELNSRRKILRLIEKVKPNIIVHCANLPKNETMKKNPLLAKKINLDATEYIVEAANKNKSKLIFISTIASILNNDYYTSYKLTSEKLTKKANFGWLIIRPAYILGLSPNTKNDRPFNRIYKNIKEKSPAIYDISWKTQSTYIGWISEIINTCIKKNIWNETITVSVKEVKSRFEMARDILSYFKIKSIPIDNKDLTGTIEDDQESLKRLNLPIYAYNQMIKKIVEELKNHFQSGL